MSAAGRFDHLRHSALDLLDAGNSSAAVGQVLGVPAEVVARWSGEPLPAAAPVDALATQRARDRAIHFRTTLAFASPLAVRLWHLGAIGLALVDVGTWLVPTWRATEFSARGAGLTLAIAFLLLSGVGLHLARSRTRLILGPDRLSVPFLFGRIAWPYADLADVWFVGHVLHEGTDREVEGRLLTLHSRRQGVRPLAIFVGDDEGFDPRLTERLDLVLRTNCGAQPLTRMSEIPRT